MQSINPKKEAMRQETAKLLGDVTFTRGDAGAAMPRGALGADSRGMMQCRLSRKGK